MNTKESTKTASEMASPAKSEASNIRLSANPRSSTANPPIVSQEQIRDLLRKRKEARQATKECQYLRAALCAQFANGAKVEAGPLNLDPRKRKCKRLTEANLRTALGDAKVDRLKQNVDPGETTVLLIDNPKAKENGE